MNTYTTGWAFPTNVKGYAGNAMIVLLLCNPLTSLLRISIQLCTG